MRASAIVVVIAVLLGTFASPTTALAGGSERAQAETLIQQLEQAPDRTRVFTGLTAAEKALVNKALQVARTERSEIPVGGSGKHGSASLSMSSGCRGMIVNDNAYNFYGYLLWRYSQTLYWCWSTDSNQVYGLNHYQSVTVNCCWWAFQGTVGDFHRGGENQSYFYAWAQGAFTYCPPIFGCVQSAYPQVWQQVDGQGGYASGIG